jgi:hypothetical protein
MSSGDSGMPSDGGVAVTTTSMFSEGLCDRTGTVGGCRIGSGSYMTTIWYYGPVYTTDSARTGCMSAGGTFVAP